MMYKVGTRKQYQDIYEELNKSIPTLVLETIEERIIILDDNYGEERDIVQDMGGFCCVLVEESMNDAMQKLLKEYLVDIELYEYEEQIADTEWNERLYLVNDEFSIVFFMKYERGEI